MCPDEPHAVWEDDHVFVDSHPVRGGQVVSVGMVHLDACWQGAPLIREASFDCVRLEEHVGILSRGRLDLLPRD